MNKEMKLALKAKKILATLAIIALFGVAVMRAVPVHAADGVTVPSAPPPFADSEPPLITIIQPLEGTTIADDRPWLEGQISDVESGIEREAISISVDGVDVTAAAIIERMDLQEIGTAKEWRVRYRPQVALPAGQHRVQIEAVDMAGNRNRRQWYFIIAATPPDTATAQKPEVCCVQNSPMALENKGVALSGSKARPYWAASFGMRTSSCCRLLIL